MGLELELPELAVLRPIRTAVRKGGGAMTPRRGDTGGVVDGIGGATPTERGEIAERRNEGEVVDGVEASWVVGDAPVMASGSTARLQGGGGEEGGAGAAADDDDGCATPKSAASTLRPATVCPPAPRKPRPAKRKHRYCGSRPPPRRPFFPAPHDLTTVFVPRAAAASSAAAPCPPAAKKIRVHAVG